MLETNTLSAKAVLAVTVQLTMLAIDQRTRMFLFKLLNRHVFNNINGCISTGKEASVSHATNLTGKNWQSRPTRLRCWCSIIYTEDIRFGEKCGRGCDSDDNEEGHRRHVYRRIMGLSQAVTKGDANAMEKATDLGNDTKACGSESDSNTDVDEDSEGNESASNTEVVPPADKKASRKENKKKVKRRKGSEEKQSLRGCEERREKLAKAHKTGWPFMAVVLIYMFGISQ